MEHNVEQRTYRAARTRAALLSLCTAFLAPAAQAQLTDWFWEPQGISLDMQQDSNWVIGGPGGQRASTAPNDMVRGRSSATYSLAELQGLVTLGSLSSDHELRILGVAPGAALILGNTQSAAALMVGAEGTSLPRTLHFDAIAVNSSGSALVHGARTLRLAGQAAWAHQGTLVVGASMPLPGLESTRAWLYLTAGATLGPGFGQLDIVVGSAGLGKLWAASGAGVLANTLTLGAGAPQSARDLLEIDRSSVQVTRNLQIGRLNGALAQVGGVAGQHGDLVAERVQVGDAGGGASELRVGAWGQARLNQLSVGTLDGSTGHVDVGANGQLDVTNTLSLGGQGRGSLSSQGTLTAQAVYLGGQSPGAGGEFVTMADTRLQRVNVSARSTWVTQGSTFVSDMVTVAEYGGQDILLRVTNGGELHIARDLWVGDYHHFETQPIDQRVVVEPGGRLVVDGGISIFATASLSGGGTVVTPRLSVDSGTVAPGMSPGHLTIAGDVAFNGGQLVIELGGLAPGSEYDVLEVLGTLTLSQQGRGTTLVLQAVDGFVPQPGQGFDFLRAGQINGSFASLVDLTGLRLTLGDLEFANGHLGINLAAAVPEPQAGWLMLAGVVLLALRRRQRH